MNTLIDRSVLLIEDDIDFATMLSFGFQQSGMKCHIAHSVEDGMRTLIDTKPSIVITDIDLPGKDGWQAIDYIRDFADIPILVLSGLIDSSNVVRALDSGATDFLPKPISPKVLVARVKAVLNSRPVDQDAISTEYLYDDGYLAIEPLKYLVKVNDDAVKLSKREFKLLSYLALNADRILSLTEILENVWGWEYRDNTEYIHVYMSRLRRKIEPDPKAPRYFLSVYGIGYRFESMQ